MAISAYKSHSIFNIHQDLDGEKSPTEFKNREQFIGLVVGSEEFLLPIMRIREIILLPKIAFVPNPPPFVEGVINLRGTILPAINMRKMMGMPKPQKTSSARIIIAKQDLVICGLIVDAITYVMPLMPQDIQTHNLPVKGTGSEFIGSLCKQSTKVKGILDLSRIMKLLSVNKPADSSGKTST